MPIWNRQIWEQPQGLPNGQSLTINNGASTTSSRTVTLYPFCISAAEMLVSEESDFSDKDGDDWTAYAKTSSFTLSSGDEEKTVYIKYRNVAQYESGTVSASITLDSDLPGGGIQGDLLDRIITILRADTTLQARDDDWDSTTVPHVIPGIQGEAPTLGGERNLVRAPFVEVGIGNTAVSKDGTYYNLDCSFTMRCWIAHGTDTSTAAREKTVNGFMWDVWDALNAYWRLEACVYVLEHFPTAFNPRALEGDAVTCGEMTYMVRVGLALIEPS